MPKNHNFLPKIILSQILLLFLLLISTMAADSSSSEAKVHIVYTERPEGQEPEEYHIKTLSSVLGSEDAAKGALLYSYKHAASGFSAKLTPEQVSQLSNKRACFKSSLAKLSSFTLDMGRDTFEGLMLYQS